MGDAADAADAAGAAGAAVVADANAVDAADAANAADAADAAGAAGAADAADAADKSLENEAEGIWSQDIEKSFQAALAIYPPCGRRKIILSDKGKMYGRNELIARYIKLKTGKTRTRKQVSSHIQVLARRNTREAQAKLKAQEEENKALESMAAASSSQLYLETDFQKKVDLPVPYCQPRTITVQQTTDVFDFWTEDIKQGRTIPDMQFIFQAPYPCTSIAAASAASDYLTNPGEGSSLTSTTTYWSPISTETLQLAEFTAFKEWQNERNPFKRHRFVHIDITRMCEQPLETVDIRQIYDKFPERGGLRDLYNQGPPHAFFLVKFWADLNFSLLEEQHEVFYGVSSRYEGTRPLTLSCTTKVCSFGKLVVEKLETSEPPYWDGGNFIFRIQRSPLCQYIINFIRKLRVLPEKQMMDSVLENFSVLQILRDQETEELLLCVAFLFEVTTREWGAQQHIYRLGWD